MLAHTTCIHVRLPLNRTVRARSLAYAVVHDALATGPYEPGRTDVDPSEVCDDRSTSQTAEFIPSAGLASFWDTTYLFDSGSTWPAPNLRRVVNPCLCGSRIESCNTGPYFPRKKADIDETTTPPIFPKCITPAKPTSGLTGTCVWANGTQKQVRAIILLTRSVRADKKCRPPASFNHFTTNYGQKTRTTLNDQSVPFFPTVCLTPDYFTPE